MEEKKIHSPYPGLRPYREDERDKFFGREADKAILVDKILGNRLTLLFAASGVGKSSLLQAAVIPHLKAAGGENLSVVYSIDWVRDEHSTPLSRLHDAILKALRDDGTLPVDAQPETGTLAELLEFCGLFARPPLVLILDQFEEFFRYQQHSTAFRPFIEQLTEVITDVALPVSVVISMREDYAMELNAFKPQLPTLLFENFFRLEKLNRKAAMQAILDPARQAGCDYEPALLERLLQDLQDPKREQAGLPHTTTPVEGLEVVDPPYLQIVCAYLWKLKGADETTLRLANYAKAGGIDGILNYFLDDALNSLSSAEKQLASRAFDFLAAQRGVKMAYPLDVLANKILKVKETKLGKVLAKLARRDMNILRDQTRNGVMWYELYHDMFSDSIEKWNNRWKARRQKRQRWLMGTAITVLAVVLGILVDSFLWIYRNNFPADYLFQEQKFRLMEWDLLPKPYPEMVDIPASDGEFQSGELDKDFGEMANSSLKEQGSYNQQNFGYPSIAASIPVPFAIGKYEISYEQYDYYVWQQRRAGEIEEELIYPTGATRDNGRGKRAVTQVSWNEAMAYTQWLNNKIGEETGKEYRLPTEVEWEYAARAGKKTAYPWGDEAKGLNKANCDGCGSQWDNLLVAPIDSFAANPWGLHNTSGNVWEWTCSEWKPELGDEAKQCARDGASVRRVIRGGSWYINTDWVRSSARLWNNTGNRNDNVGFRVVRVSRQD